MISFLKKIPLTLKLVLIGTIPIIFLIYFSMVIYKGKKQKLEVMGDYIERINQSAVLGDLINNLGIERKFSIRYLLTDSFFNELSQQRTISDSIINEIVQENDFGLSGFKEYTFLDELPAVRSKISTTTPAFSINSVIDYYSSTIYKLNSLNASIPSSNVYLTSIYQDLLAQKILSDYITIFEIIRTNVFNSLNSRQYMVETLLGSYGAYKTIKSYEIEFRLKASAQSSELFDSIRNKTSFKPTMDYLDSLFTNFEYDNTYDANEWWQISSTGIAFIKEMQHNLWQSAESQMVIAYNTEKKLQNVAFILIAISILFVVAFVFFFAGIILSQLREIKNAARKISRGATGVNLKNMPRGTIGSLAKSILQIERNNLTMARAANEIGSGNFNVKINPRSEDDLLGKSIQKMKHDLREFNSQKDKIQKETLDLVRKRDEFFSMTSHELKTPVTSLKAYTQLLLMDANNPGDTDEKVRKGMLEKIEKQVDKLVTLINDLLDTSRLQYGELHYHKRAVKLNNVVSGIISEIQLSNPEHRIIFQKNINVQVFVDEDRIGQVVSNLLTNAIKYAPQSKEIIVRLDKHGDKVICSVRDFGYGIESYHYEKIFERFYRISEENMHTFPGLGVGLFISKQIIEKHDGRLWLDSELGKGSTFYFELSVFTKS